MIEGRPASSIGSLPPEYCLLELRPAQNRENTRILKVVFLAKYFFHLDEPTSCAKNNSKLWRHLFYLAIMIIWIPGGRAHQIRAPLRPPADDRFRARPLLKIRRLVTPTAQSQLPTCHILSFLVYLCPVRTLPALSESIAFPVMLPTSVLSHSPTHAGAGPFGRHHRELHERVRLSPLPLPLSSKSSYASSLHRLSAMLICQMLLDMHAVHL